MKLWVWITAGVAALGALVGVGVYEEKKHSGGGEQPTQLTPGHRYALTLSCPGAASIPVPAATSLQNTWAQGTLLVALSPVVVQSVSTSGDGPANQAGVKLVQSITVVFDYSGAAMTLPEIKAGNGTACSSSLVDQGPTSGGPVGIKWGPHGGQGGQQSGPQVVNVSNSSPANAQFVQGAKLIIHIPAGSVFTAIQGAPLDPKTVTFGGAAARGTLVGTGIVVAQYTQNGTAQQSMIQVS